MSNVIKLGHIDLKHKEVFACKDCGSRNVDVVPGEVDKDYISSFVRSRAQRLGIAVADYDIHIDKSSGEVTATPKDIQLEFDLS